MTAVFFASGQAMRDWLEANHASADELWIGIYKKGSGKTGVTLPEAQDVAMCFGWVDSMSRRIDEDSYMLRFTPRRPRSSWTPGNVARAEELLAHLKHTIAELETRQTSRRALAKKRLDELSRPSG